MRLATLVTLAATCACVPNDPPDRRTATSAAVTRSGGKPAELAPRVPRPGRPFSGAARGSASSPVPHAPPAADDPALAAPFQDDFARAELGPDWLATGPAWRIEEGQLCARGARNHPVWLKRRLPTNARIEFDATSSSPDGDLKAEFWGDGRGFAKGASYDDATSYVAIFGGWRNTYHVLARIDEHAPDRPQVRIDPESEDPAMKRVEPDQAYRFKVERADGKTVRWYVDDVEILSYPDEAPLTGPGHDHFGFNDWDVKVCFDNVALTPL